MQTAPAFLSLFASRVRGSKVMSFRALVLLQVAIGCLLGVARASFQSVVDPAQALAGAVSYDSGEAFAQYLNANINLQTVLAALLLRLGVNELIISTLFSCFATVCYLLA